MNITGIIAEYNPFHNGHLYHLSKARQVTNADYIVVIMSGDYMQRGTPALLDKYTRAQMALQAGADLVLELPTLFACGGAEFFAEGAIGILDDLGSINALCFGAETANQKQLDFIADQFLLETSAFKERLRTLLSEGMTYPKARSNAFLESLHESERLEYEFILKTPNNILGIEYTKALKRRKSSIKPYPITRMNSGYHDKTLPKEGFCSATAIRNSIHSLQSLPQNEIQKQIEILKTQMPTTSLELLLSALEQKKFVFENDFSMLLQYKLLQTKSCVPYADWNLELSNRLYQVYSPSQSFLELATALKSRQYTLTRIQRALLHVILDIQEKDLSLAKQLGFHSYAKVLGFKKTSSPLLKQLRKTASIPVIQQLAKSETFLSPYEKTLFELDRQAHKLYQMVLCQSHSIPYEEEFSRKPLVLP